MIEYFYVDYFYYVNYYNHYFELFIIIKYILSILVYRAGSWAGV